MPYLSNDRLRNGEADIVNRLIKHGGAGFTGAHLC